MNLAVFLSPGDSLEKQSLVGQDERFINYYLKPYSKNFEKVFIFSYGDKNYLKKLPSGIVLLPNKHSLPRLIYQFILCFLYSTQVRNCNVFRVMQTSGGIPAIVGRIFFGKPFIVTYGFDYQSISQLEGKRIRAVLFPLLLAIILKLADSVFVTTKKNLKILSKKIGKKVIYIPNGVDIYKFKPQKKRNKNFFTILNIGRLVKQKNQQLLIKAVGLSRFKKNIKLQIIGSGPLKKDLLRIAEQKGVILEIIDHIDYGKMPFHYINAELFCLPSLEEGSPKVLIEALSSGCICVVSDIPQHREIISDKINGFLCAQNVGKFTKLIDMILENPYRVQKMRKKARQIVAEKYNIHKLIAKEIVYLKK